MLECFSFQISCWNGLFKMMLQCFCAAGRWTWSRRVRHVDLFLFRLLVFLTSVFCFLWTRLVCMNKSVKQPKACQQFVKQLKLSSSPPTVQGVSPPPLCLIVKVKYFKHTHLSQGLFLETHQPVWWHRTVFRSCFHHQSLQLKFETAKLCSPHRQFTCNQSLLRPDWSVRPETRKLLIPSVSSAEWTEMSEQRSVRAQCLGLIEATSAPGPVMFKIRDQYKQKHFLLTNQVPGNQFILAGRALRPERADF